MIEVNELIFRWHRGDPLAQIARSLGTDRKTVRKYVRMAKAAGLEKGAALPADHEVAARLAPKRTADAKPPLTPGKDRLVPYHDQLKKWADYPRVTIGYTCLRESLIRR